MRRAPFAGQEGMAMNIISTSVPLSGIGLSLPQEPLHTAVAALLVVLAVSYAFLLWAVRRTAHDRAHS